MKRLTSKSCSYNWVKDKQFQDIALKLQEYENTGLTPAEIEQLQKENAELKSRLEKSVELPCKVGDTVYVIMQRKKIDIVEDIIRNVRRHSDNTWWLEFSDLWVDKTFDDFGKTVFLTKEEAEQALKEREENETRT